MDQELFSNKVFWSGSNNLSHVNPKLQGKMSLIVQHLVLMKTNLPALNGMANYSLLNASKKEKNVMVSMIVSMVQMNWSVYWPALPMVNINVFMKTIWLCPWSVFQKLKDVFVTTNLSTPGRPRLHIFAKIASALDLHQSMADRIESVCQYNRMVCWVVWRKDASTKGLMFKVLFFFWGLSHIFFFALSKRSRC